MLQLYITGDEFRRFHPIDRFIKSDAELLNSLSAAAYDVAEDLRSRGFAAAGVQAPRMFDGAEAYATTTKAAAYTCAAMSGYNEGRFVVINSAGLSGVASFRLEGSHDGSIWRTVQGMDGNPLVLYVTGEGIASSLFFERFTQYRYALDTSESITYSAFLVDSSTDALIRYRAVVTMLSPHADESTTLAGIVIDAQQRYSSGFARLVLDYQQDSDGDGDIDSIDLDVRPSVRLYR